MLATYAGVLGGEDCAAPVAAVVAPVAPAAAALFVLCAASVTTVTFSGAGVRATRLPLGIAHPVVAASIAVVATPGNASSASAPPFGVPPRVELLVLVDGGDPASPFWTLAGLPLRVASKGTMGAAATPGFS